jgi:hypothetical protein
VKNRSLHDIERNPTELSWLFRCLHSAPFANMWVEKGENVCTKLKAETKLDFLSYHTSMNIRAIDVAIFITQNKCSVYAFAESEKNFFSSPP